MFSKIKQSIIIFSFIVSGFGLVMAAEDEQKPGIAVEQTLDQKKVVVEAATQNAVIQNVDAPQSSEQKFEQKFEQKPEQKVDQKKDQQTQEIANGIIDLLNFKEEDIFKNIMEFYQKSILKRREDMWKKTPAELHNDILESQEAFQHFVAKFSLGDCLLTLCETLRRDLDKLAQQNIQTEILEPLLNELERLHRALITGGFKTFVQTIKPQGGSLQMPLFNALDLGSMLANMQDGMRGLSDEMADEPYEEEDLVALLQALDACLPLLSHDQFKNVQQPMHHLHKLMSALYQKDVQTLVIYAMNCLEDDFKVTRELLSETLNKLDIFIKTLANKPEEKDAKKAIEYWRRDIAKFTRSLNVFASIKHHAGFRTPQSLYTFFKIVTHAYEACHGLLDLYQKDVKRDHRAMMISSAMDWAFTSSLSMWFFFAQQADYLNDLVTDTVLGTKSIGSLDDKQVLLQRGIAAVQALPLAVNPSTWNEPPSKITKISTKITTALVYYHLFHVKLFGNPSQGLWPNTDKHLKNAMLYAFQSGKKFMATTIVDSVYWNSDPETLEALEKWTLGIVKPELIGEAIDILFPFFFWQRIPIVDGMAHFERKDLYKGYLDYDALRKRFGDDKAAEKNEHEAQLDREYLERRFFDYAMSSVGMYGGSYLAYTYQKPIGRMLKKAAGGVAQALVYMNLFDQETIDTWTHEAEDLHEEFEQMLMVLKVMLKSVLQEDSALREKMIPLLLQRGILKEEDTVGKKKAVAKKINRRIVRLVLNTLASYRLVSYMEAASISRAFRKNPKSLDSTVDKVVDAIRNNLIGMAGGFVGSHCMEWFGQKIAYPKLKAWFGSPIMTGDVEGEVAA